MRRMTITEGLAELKLLTKRIDKAIYKDYVWSAKKSKMTDGEVAEHRAIAETNVKSVTDLIKNRNEIKAAIVKSNATTMVNVAGVEMTVAEAIERKVNIEFDKALLAEWKRQYTQATNNVETQNLQVQERIDNMLSQIASSSKSDIEEAQRVMSATYMENNGWELFDPINLKDRIEVLDAQIDQFEKNVDIVLSMSNAVTFIEV